EGDRRCLAVGAADGDHVGGRPPERQPRGHLAHALEPHLDGLGVLALDVAEPVLESLAHGNTGSCLRGRGTWTTAAATHGGDGRSPAARATARGMERADTGCGRQPLAARARPPLAARAATYRARCTASPKNAVWCEQSFRRTTSRLSRVSPSSRLSVVGAWRNVHSRDSG